MLPLYRLHVSATAVNILDAFTSILRNDLGFDQSVSENHDKIGGVTTDNASNMICFGHSSNMQHVRCITHSIHLSVRGVFEQHDIQSMLSSVRELCIMFRQQQKYIEALSKADIPKCRTTVLDVPTRWNSTFDMLERFVALKTAIVTALAELGDFENAVGGSTWKLCEELIEFLEPLSLATTRLSAGRQITISLVVPTLNAFRQRLVAVVSIDSDASNDSAEMLTIRQRFKAAFDRYLAKYLTWDSVHAMSTLLDPRYRTFASASILIATPPLQSTRSTSSK